MGTIANGANRPLNVQTGTVPDVGGGMRDWFQPMVFERVVKTVSGYQVVEDGDPISFRGVIQPLTDRQLQLKPEGQRAWTWLWLHADPVLSLEVDEVVLYLGVQTRVMSRKDYTIYGYVAYSLVQDWEGSGPTVPAPAETVLDGGTPTTTDYDETIDGGTPTTTDYDETIDGGTPTTTEFEEDVDGGTP